MSIVTTASGILVEFGMGSALVQKKDIEGGQFSAAFWVVFVFSIAVSAIVWLSAEYLESWLALPLLAVVLRATVLVVPLVSLQLVPRAYMSRKFRFRTYASIDAASAAVGILIALVVLHFTVSVWVLVVQNVTTSLIRTVCFWLVAEWKPSFRFRIRDISVLYKFGMHVASFNLLNFVGKYFDDAIVGKVLGGFSLGLYNFSYRIIGFQQEVVSGALNQMALPAYARVQGSKPNVFSLFCKDTQFMVTLSLPLLTFILVMAPAMVPWVIGERWIAAIPVMQILIVEAMRQSLLSLGSSAMLSVGDSRRFMNYALVSAPVLVVSFVLGVHWGIVGVATSLLVFNSGLMLYLLFLLHSSFSLSLRPLYWQWLPGVALSAIMFFALSPVAFASANSPRPYLWGIFLCILAVMIFLLFLRSLFPVSEQLVKNTFGPFLSFSRSEAPKSLRTKTVYLDPLWSGANPHLTSLHNAIARRYPHITLRELNFRTFITKLPEYLLTLRREEKSGNVRETTILHFHFVIRVYDSRNVVSSCARSIRFLAGVALCRLLGVKIIWTFHDDRAHDFSHRKIEKLFLASLATMSDRIISLSLKGMELLWNSYGRSEGVFFTAHPSYRGVYPDSVSRKRARQKLHLKDSESIYLFFGKVLSYKGVSDLVDVFHHWNPSRPVRLIIAGEYRDKELEQRIRISASMDSRITIVDRHIPDDEIQLYMRCADFGVLPYREILHSGTAMLFSGFECPIIVPDTGWFPEIFERHRIGIMYEYTSKDGLWNALEASLNHKREDYRSAIKEFCDEQTIEHAADMTASVYENCDR